MCYLTRDSALLGCFGLRSSLQLARLTTPPAEHDLLGKGETKCTLLLGKERHAHGPTPGLRAHRLQAWVLQSSAGGSLVATGGQQGGIPPQTCVTLQTARLSLAAGCGQAGRLRTPLPQGRHTLLPNTPQRSGAVHSSPAQDELVPSEPARLCSISAAF